MSKAAKSEFDNDYYMKLTNSSGKLNNALLANVVNEKINEKKRRIAKINISNEFVNYRNQLEKLKWVKKKWLNLNNEEFTNDFFRSLKIGFVHNVLSEKNIEELDLHLNFAEKLLTKITEILSDHVLHDASGVISKSELEELSNNKISLELIQTDLLSIPNVAAPYIKDITEFQESLRKIVECINTVTCELKENESNVLKHTSKVMDCLWNKIILFYLF